MEKMTEFECGPINFTTDEGLQVLRDVHLEFRSPALIVINGPSGCGKSTLLRAITGLNRAEVALRRLGGESFHEKNLPVWRARVTLLLQDAPCLEGTILENLTFPFRFKTGAGKKFSETGILEALEKVSLSHIPLDADAHRLSGGERHRLGIVRGLLWAPEVLIADEPLSGLEPELADRCFQLLKDYSVTRDAVVICVLHEERFARKADHWLRLENGTLHRINTL